MFWHFLHIKTGSAAQKIFHPKHECSKCEKIFQDKANLNRHVEASRSDLICDVCTQEFCLTVDFSKHMRGHQQRKFWCPYCKKSFSTKFNQQTHTANRSDHSCKQCANVLQQTKFWVALQWSTWYEDLWDLLHTVRPQEL